MALTGMEIYKLLPRTNCKDCGFPTCMAFAMQVAAKQKALTDCPHVSEEAKEELSAAAAPPMKLVKIGGEGNQFVFGQETVMFRHEEKFHHPTGLAVRIPASLSDEKASARAAKLKECVFTRVGETLKVELAAVEIDGCADPAKRARDAAAASGLPLLLLGSDPEKMKAGVEAVKEGRPLVYKADAANIDAFADLASAAGVPLAVGGASLEETADLTSRAKEKGVEEMVLAFTGDDMGETIRLLTRARRAALKKNFRALGYPAAVEVKSSSPEEESVMAAAYAAKYAGIVICDGCEPWELLPVMTTVQNVYTDPQVPNTVEAKLYEVGPVDENSPVMFTTNFSLTYFSVESEVERSKIPAYISVVDTEGLGVLNAYAGDTISAEKVVKTLKEQGVAEKVKHRKLIIPGLLPIFRAEIEDTSEWKEVIIGPETANRIPAFLNEIWKRNTESECRVRFVGLDKTVVVKKGTTLLDAAHKAEITINNLCGGDGICGRCRMIVKEGEISGAVSGKLTREEIKAGYVLACQTVVEGDVVVEIPPETLARDRRRADEDADRFLSFRPSMYSTLYAPAPLVTKVYIELDPPTLENNTADHQRVCEAIQREVKVPSMQMGLKVIRQLPRILRESDYKVTATIGLRRDIAEVMQIEGGDTSDRSYMVVVDMGTTTIVAHLVDTTTLETVAASACFNSQGVHGREVTGRMITAERIGNEKLQELLVNDINRLIESTAREAGIAYRDIIAVVCAGNTVMSHFLLGLPTHHIRRYPYVAASVEPPPLRAAEVGIEINPRGLLYSLPGISGWVGSDITAGILATGMHESEQISLLMDIGTNGEIVIGNREWLMACSASAGPALEGASVECGMRAGKGAIESITRTDGGITYKTVGDVPPVGLCGSGIIDALCVLLKEKVIDRSGKFVEGHEKVREEKGEKRFVFVPPGESGRPDGVFLSESDIENIITAKAAIFAAVNILVRRLSLSFDDIERIYIAGAFGNYLNLENAVCIGLIPDVDLEKITFVGNTSIWGAKIVAFYEEAFAAIRGISRNTTYYDLMGAADYVEEFQRALFLPHTDIQLFPHVTV